MKEGIKPWMLFAGMYITVIASIWTYNKMLKPKTNLTAMK